MTRNRRRLLIAIGVVLVLGGVLRWLIRPPIDPRLLGTWRMASSNGGDIFHRITFHDDGTATAGSFRFHWSVDGPMLTRQSPSAEIPHFLLWLYSYVTGKSVDIQVDRSEMIEVTPRKIRLRDGRILYRMMD